MTAAKTWPRRYLRDVCWMNAIEVYVLDWYTTAPPSLELKLDLERKLKAELKKSLRQETDSNAKNYGYILSHRPHIRCSHAGSNAAQLLARKILLCFAIAFAPTRSLTCLYTSSP
ncbi:hypothetical protein G7K_1525-t1 [Saitoella complicata NRRL Y-17804]|uniref:Uncharacterized protein n=1 Tax=Saitoella complicata (strain BCRC 22490 / CBS 7301 / JCM 7358 / NBRC 10748 / NRRL Y-17804) TaxID=698492 RepID=A0A0E9NBR5_SAICN|nr:hypothetical protein G7K_1525-t1 [Saitoella complicata NRRL Y-17804]